ncbi:MAG: GatB/YqeY domain-containing protein, partial [Gammaproteobacteria bacterium]|nr:GatB/YqeY domain-containing protein [Gammaproteobacteria bacterium]
SQTLKQRINEDVNAALRAREKQRLGTLRFILAAIKQKEVDEQVSLDDTAVLAVLDKLVRQYRESIAQFESAKRHDLVAKECYELEVVKEYLPAPLSATEIDALIDAAITESGASSMKDMGKVMGILKPKLQGRADMGAVSGRVKEYLGSP